ncbi:MAG: MATE family efflux transporter [Waddliaceae bacterium]
MTSIKEGLPLTRYPQGSLKELWAISWPMMLSALAGHLMIITDRLLLSRYSQEAFVAATASQSWYWTFSLSLMALICITEVFVGGYNGSNQHSEIRKVVWQMLWASFFSWVILLPLAFSVPLLLANNIQTLGGPYLQILFLFMPFYLAGFGAIGSFFVGRGETKIMPIVLTTSNILNIFLDIWFIFGGWFVPSMGIAGAAYATGISQFLGFVFFLVMFFRKRNREAFSTHKPHFSMKIMKRCFSIGIPNAFNAFVNLIGWSLIYQMLVAKTSQDQLFAYSISYSIFVFFWFVLDGLGKGICATCANSLGQKNYETMGKTIGSIIKISLFFALATSAFMVFCPDLAIFLFADDPSLYLMEQSKNVLFWAWIAIFFECVWWGLQNMLVAAGDTRYTFLINTSSFWLVSLMPIFIFVFGKGWNPSFCWKVLTVDLLVRISLLVKRYKSEKWKNKIDLLQKIED